MTQDFAKIRPEPLLEKTPIESPPAWPLMITGIFVGLSVGVSACVLFYLSGNLPPINTNNTIESSVTNNTIESDATLMEEELFTPIEEISGKEELELEFYRELRNWEVPVDAKPVELTPEQTQNQLSKNYLPSQSNATYILQTGAFQQRELAYQEMERQLALGINATIRPEDFPGRTLYLVQSGPYSTSRELNEVEELLQKHIIRSIRTSLR